MTKRPDLHVVGPDQHTRPTRPSGGSPDQPVGPDRTGHRSDTSAGLLPLRLRDICFSHQGRMFLKQINLEFEDVPATFILGPNGAGKTLLLRVCHGLLAPSQGSLEWNDPELARNARAQTMVFQRPVMLRRTVEQNIVYAMKVCKISAEEQAERLQNALQVSGLNRFSRRSALRLSGGEQQRLALARCMAIAPRVLFLDEPTAHLDPTATRQVEQIIQAMREAGSRIIMVTHDTGQARRLADRVVFMHRGRVKEHTDTDSFFSNPSSREAEAYLEGDLLW